jgi:hypothetical protein
MVPKGFYIISNGDHYGGSKGKIIININDLTNSIHHKDSSRLNRCFGLDGMDGPNRTCINGHEIGTEFSDCWMAHAMVLEQTMQ